MVKEEKIDNCFIVGVGASAGGLEALKAMFHQDIKLDNVSFIIIQHLSPDFKSSMSTILQKVTKLEIKDITSGDVVQPEKIYICPPGQNVELKGGVLFLSEHKRGGHPQFPIDAFFKSLAIEENENAIAVILSGTGSDSARGAVEIAKNDGFVICQKPEDAQFSGMPESVIGTGVVNKVCTAEKIITMIAKHVVMTKNEIESASDLSRSGSLKEIFDIIKDTYSVDLTGYKIGTISRRVRSRINKHKINDIEDYVQLIYENPVELSRLYYELLIPVTSFFRDEAFFSKIKKEVIPEIFKNSEEKKPIRVWSAGCSTGQEIYSIAILFNEYVRKNNIKNQQLTFFATDINPKVIEQASKGFFSTEEVNQIEDKSIISKYFHKQQNDTYVIDQKIRAQIIFSLHNLIEDVPFTKIDLILCRNLLVYLKKEYQNMVMANINISVKPNSFIALGPSESLLSIEKDYNPISTKWRIYRKSQNASLPRAYNPVDETKINNLIKLRRETFYNHDHLPEVPKVNDDILGYFIKDGIYIDSNKNISHLFGHGKYILEELSDGLFKNNISNIENENLRTVLEALYDEANITDALTIIKDIKIGKEIFDVQAMPLRSKSEFSCVFNFLMNGEEKKAINPKLNEMDISKADAIKIKSLEKNLADTKSKLNTSTQELSAINEELLTANEELLSSNEELQSTNEELQSVNEELHMLNSQYQETINSLTTNTSILDRMLDAKDYGAIFVDSDLSVIKFSKATENLINLRDHDIGRKITDFNWNLKNFDIIKHLSDYTKKSTSATCYIVSNQEGTLYFLKFLLLSNKKGSNDGFVISFTKVDKSFCNSVK